MGLIKEPLNVDFEFDPKPLTNEEKEKISKYYPQIFFLPIQVQISF